jgi:hypothetical protein
LHALCSDGGPDALQMLAVATLDAPHGEQLFQLATSYLRPPKPFWPAFAAVAADESRPDDVRARAVERVGLHADHTQRDLIVPLTTSASETVRAAAEAALAEYDRRWP